MNNNLYNNVIKNIPKIDLIIDNSKNEFKNIFLKIMLV